MGARRDAGLGDLLEPVLGPVAQSVRRWWLGVLERHYLMCADVEAARAREHHANVRYYQTRAALARSAKH